MKLEHKIDGQRALDDLARMIPHVAKNKRRALWKLHSELSRTAAGVRSSRAISRTGFVGVRKNELGGFCSIASIRGKRTHIGTFKTPEDAYAARARHLITLRENHCAGDVQTWPSASPRAPHSQFNNNKHHLL